MSDDEERLTHGSTEGLTPVLERNIGALMKRRVKEQAAAGIQQKLADAITAFTGSMTFVYLHLAVSGFWIAANLKWIPCVPAWDESFVVLAMVASVEAIFLSTFVLISQNRMMVEANERADLDLQVSLLTEHELTKIASLVARVARKIDVEPQSEMDEVTRTVAPEAVLDKIQETKS